MPSNMPNEPSNEKFIDLHCMVGYANGKLHIWQAETDLDEMSPVEEVDEWIMTLRVPVKKVAMSRPPEALPNIVELS